MKRTLVLCLLLTLPLAGCGGTDWGALFLANSVRLRDVFAGADAQAGDHLGWAVAIDGDLAAFGVPSEDGGPGDPAPDTGAVYVFGRADNVWQAQAKLLAPSATPLQAFGSALALSQNRLIVGSPGWAAGVGAAYVFERTENVWDEGVALSITNPSGLDRIGTSVSISGDYAVVGAPANDHSASNAGAVWVFERTGPGNAWSEGIRFQAFDLQGGDNYGTSVALSDTWLVVGAPYEDGPSDQRPDAGAIYLYERTGPGNLWSLGTKLAPADATLADNFGFSVAIDGGRLIVGAIGDDGTGSNSAPGAGSAYIFERSGNNWSETFKLQAPDPHGEDALGFSVAINGDLAVAGAPNHDGFSINIFGNSFEDDVGAIYVFGRFEDGTWGVRGAVPDYHGTLDDRMGFSIDVSGGDVVAGAVEADGGAANDLDKAGAAFIFHSPSMPPVLCAPGYWSCI